ncbi:MAG TPA: VOC family protein [Vicinamibacterales bacterium]|nr:VOC family protein [Vicinamibacterales bacterium]
MPAHTAVDHLLLGVSDLDQGIAWVERTTGIRAAGGGSHPGRGTRNALLSLGGRQYLEIIAPDPAQPASDRSRALSALKAPRLIGWAAAATDLEAATAKARAAALGVVGPRDGSRVRPDGTTLSWRTLNLVQAFGANGVDPVPFLIQWSGGSRHPSEDSPRGCELQALDIEHPDPTGVEAALQALGIDARVKQAPAPRLIARLATPKGTVTLD